MKTFYKMVDSIIRRAKEACPLIFPGGGVLPNERDETGVLVRKFREHP